MYPIIGGLRRLIRWDIEAVRLVLAIPMHTYAIDVGNRKSCDKLVVRAGLPETHHKALGAQNVRVRSRTDLRGSPEEVEACRVMLLQCFRFHMPFAIKIIDRLADCSIGICSGNNLADDSNTIAPQIMPETGSLNRVIKIAKFD